jgi:hypothetical protein
MVRAVLLGLVVIVGCGAPEVLPPEADAPSPLPQPGSAPAGWSVAEGPAEYLPGTLYEVMNGGAERYETYGFRRLVHTRYQLGDDPLACVSLDLYDMGSELGAFGIYAAGRPVAAEERDWGVEGYRDGAIAAAFKGAVFVHGEADDERPELIEVLERLVTDALADVDAEATSPAVLDLLPSSGRVDRSERYVAADLLGHSFLPGGVLAAYEIGGLNDELFFSDLGDPGAAADALDRLAAALVQRGATVVRTTADAIDFTDRIAGSGTVVTAGSYVAGSYGELEAGARQRTLAELVDRLERTAETFSGGKPTTAPGP